MTPVLVLSAALLAAPPADPAPAQQQRKGSPPPELATGSRFPAREMRREYDGDKIRRIVWDYGQCVVKKEPETSLRFALSVGEERSALVKKVANGNCLMVATAASGGVQMQFRETQMAYALAEAIVARNPARYPLLDVKTLPRLSHPAFNPAEFVLKPNASQEEVAGHERAVAAARASAFLSEFGECVVRADPAAARNLLMTEVGKPEESTAFVALGGALGQCVLAGQKLQANKSDIRGTIALSYVRLTHSPRTSPAQGAVK